MKKDNLYDVSGMITDDLVAKAALPRRTAYRKNSWLRYSVTAACVCLILLAGTFSMPHILNRISTQNPAGTKTTDHVEDVLVKDPTIVFGNKNYYPLDTNHAREFGFAETLTEKEVGTLLGYVSDGNEKGKEIYAYLPVGCEAVVAIKSNSKFLLYSFLNFTSYVSNQDENAVEYLKLYGIHSYDDIKKITVGEKILAASDIKAFYNMFSALKNSSDAYFNALSNYSAKMSTGISDNQEPAGKTVAPENSGTKPGSISGSEGTAGNALDASKKIVIYTQNGLFFEIYYYPNIGFISRYQVGSDFQALLEQ